MVAVCSATAFQQLSSAQGAFAAADSVVAGHRTVVNEVHMSDQGNNQGAVLRDRFSQQARQVIFFARLELSAHPASRIEPEHIVMGILRVDPMLISANLARDWTTERVETSLTLPAAPGLSALPEHVEVPVSPSVLALLRRAVVTADQLGSREVQPRHLLVALLDDESLPVVNLLREAGVSREVILEGLKGRPER